MQKRAYRRRSIALADGSFEIPTIVSPQLWQLCSQLAEQWRIEPEQAFGILLDRLTHMIDGGQAEMFGPEYAYAYQKLVAQDKYSSGGLPPIDPGQLHGSTRTKSGFVGVYANGKGFRAMAKTVGSSVQKSIGTFATAEQAAWARCLHYKKHQMPYGELEEALDEAREMVGQDASDEDALAHVNDIRRAQGRPTFELPTEDKPRPQREASKPAAGIVPFGFDANNIPKEFG